MSDMEDILRDLVLANRILGHEGVVDAYGHVSVRSPDNPNRYFISRSRSPELVERADLIEFTLDGQPVKASESRPFYIERHIHGGIYEARPEIKAVVHSHAYETLPFGISKVPLRPVIHSAGPLGHRIPVWDIRTKFGDTTLLVSNMDQGRDLARTLANDRVALMRGHGFAASAPSLREVVRYAIYMPKNAGVLMEALRLGGEITPLSSGEIDQRLAQRTQGPEWDRAWEYWAMRAGCGHLLDRPRATKKAPAKKAAKKAAKKKGRR
jgi:ribulose-5-phosphate 4-epimerase/fuculose-1-phosphate aldolase